MHALGAGGTPKALDVSRELSRERRRDVLGKHDGDVLAFLGGHHQGATGNIDAFHDPVTLVRTDVVGFGFLSPMSCNASVGCGLIGGGKRLKMQNCEVMEFGAYRSPERNHSYFMQFY